MIKVAIITGPLAIPFAVEEENIGMIIFTSISVFIHISFAFLCHCALLKWFNNPIAFYASGKIKNLEYHIFAVDNFYGPNQKIENLVNLLKMPNSQIKSMTQLIDSKV